eukprot:TRINITY_DN5260_c0_g1_i2.p1 TRINITY_DN5260_c0_g1~~TRINITY_DN5260_c0_g1_i2.p1  ORF type:complete len:366 (-),score=78.59 TRINITY_DN5260_c0_g1_i2:1300-2397(-)
MSESLESAVEWKDALQNQVDISQGRKEEVKTGTDDDKISVDDFEMLAVIGQGSFGKVVQVRMRSTQDIFAMKILNKKNIIERGEIEHTKAEKNILMRINHPFLMRLHYSFQTPDKLYLVMDFVNGGELFFHLQKDRRFSEERSKFYASEIVLGLQHLHENGIVYRDLKPENLLLDDEGHVKITDFGLSKEGMLGDERTKTFCGTPEYLAPEILDGKQYGRAVDWWSLGTLIYEMLVGLPPFYNEDVQKMYHQKMTAEVSIPDRLDESTKDIIRKFLDKNPETRLQNPEEIKSHPYFSGIDWEKLLARELEPPYKPSVASKDSTKMIDRQFTSKDVRKEVGTSEPVHVDVFAGFTYHGTTQHENKQ